MRRTARDAHRAAPDYQYLSAGRKLSQFIHQILVEDVLQRGADLLVVHEQVSQLVKAP